METFADSEQDTQRQTKKTIIKEREKERERDGLLLVCCCITDVLRSCGLHILSHVVVRDVSVSLLGLFHCHISRSLKYAPATAHFNAKIKKR